MSIRGSPYGAFQLISTGEISCPRHIVMSACKKTAVCHLCSGIPMVTVSTQHNFQSTALWYLHGITTKNIGSTKTRLISSGGQFLLFFSFSQRIYFVIVRLFSRGTYRSEANSGKDLSPLVYQAMQLFFGLF